MLIEKVDKESVAIMVRHFYASILEDDILKPFFINKLGSDFDGTRWFEHLKVLDAFWMLMMTGQRGYGGDPFPSHAFIGRLSPEAFERWLELFKKSVTHFFTPKVADKFYSKAERLADQFMYNLEIGKYASEDDDDDYY